MSSLKFNQALLQLEHFGLEMDIPRPVTSADINLCEHEIGYVLPKSYREFLMKYGFGGVEAVEFYGLVSGHLRKNCYLNAYVFNQDLQNHHSFPKELFAFENFDGDAVACLQLVKMENGECPIVLWEHSEGYQKQIQDPHVLANSFGTYFYKKVEELLEDEGLINQN